MDQQASNWQRISVCHRFLVWVAQATRFLYGSLRNSMPGHSAAFASAEILWFWTNLQTSCTIISNVWWADGFSRTLQRTRKQMENSGFANALEILKPCTKPLKCKYYYFGTREYEYWKFSTRVLWVQSTGTPALGPYHIREGQDIGCIYCVQYLAFVLSNLHCVETGYQVYCIILH